MSQNLSSAAVVIGALRVNFLFFRSTKPWDIFRTTAKESSQSDEENKYWNTVNVITKIIVCAFLFFLVLGTAVISKTCLIIITSNIHLFPFTSMGNNSRQSLRSANGALDFSGTSGSTVKTNVLWIWALIMIMGTPYFFILVRCTWRLVFQVSKRKAVTLSVLIPVSFIRVTSIMQLRTCITKMDTHSRKITSYGNFHTIRENVDIS